MTGLPISRRVVLAGSASAALAAGVTLGAATAALGQTPLRRRVDANDPISGPAATAEYRAAVKALKARGPNHPTGWAAWSAVHRQFCPHGNWYFLPWHRAYLLAFEQSCAEAIGKPDFALPYWNWTTFRQLPAGFVDPDLGGQANALFHAQRVMKKNDTLSSILAPAGIDAESIFGQANIQSIMGAKRFQAFGSFKPNAQTSTDPIWQRANGAKTTLESGPHDYCHGVVGGDMGNPTISPNDPVFYLHHANIDRIWALWNGAGNGNETDANWTNFVFKKNFPKPDGSAGDDVKISSVSDTRALGYEYDDQPPPSLTPASSPLPFNLKNFGALKLNDQVKLGAASTLGFARAGDFDARVNEVVEAPPQKAERLFVRLDGVTRPEDPRTNVRVFLNCDYLTAMTPTDDPHYAGSFTFFTPRGNDGDHAAHGGATQSFAIDVTDTVKNLKALGLDPKAELQVQLMPVGYGGKPSSGGDFKVESIEFATI